MRLPPFELIQPASLDEAVAALAGVDGDARLIAGGTALVPMLRLGLLRPARLVSLHRVAGLADLTMDGGALRMGAMASMAAVARSAIVRDGWPLVAEAARRVATPAIRSAATVGGNLAYAEAASDPAPALLCLGAEVEIAGPTGRRGLPLARFLTGYYETALAPGEIVTTVRVPAPPAGARSGYVKFCPRSLEDKPLVGVAALVVLDESGRRCREARIALGGAAPTAIRAARAESLLRGVALDEAAIAEAAGAAAAEASPLSDLMGTADYRREMVRVWVRRLLGSLSAPGAAAAAPDASVSPGAPVSPRAAPLSPPGATAG
jgi:carbon-monoxide dehydrogenase medium subunit